MSIWRVSNKTGSGTLLESVLAARNFPIIQSSNYPVTLSGSFPSALRFAQAIRNQEKIAVFGDYDCDGVCAAAVVELFLKKLGAKPIVRLPTREEGYGMRPEQAKELAEKGAALIVTVDNGIAAVEAVRAAKELGVDVIVTDHHEPPEVLPSTPFLVNPKLYKKGFTEYSGAGVAYLLCCEAARLLGKPEPAELLDLVALATVVDACPVTGENHALSRKGLLQMRKKLRPGISALADVARAKKLGGYALAWQIGPRVNAAGRMADPALAYRLITAESTNEALSAARDIDRLNTKRQELVEKAVKECLKNYKNQDFPVFVTEYPHGIVGVVAGRLAEILCRPVLVGSLEGNKVRASGRTTGGFDLFGAFLECQEKTGLFSALGGHKKAAGVSFTVDDTERIALSLEEIARRELCPEDRVKSIGVDAVLRRVPAPEEVAELDVLEPYGEENPEPTFYVSGPVEVVRQNCDWVLIRLRGLKMFVKPEDLQGKTMDAVVNLRVDERDGVITQRVDARPFSLTRKRLAECYDSWKNGMTVLEIAGDIFAELGLVPGENKKKVNLLESATYQKYGLY